ncbi:MAG: hypothetical protein J5476_04075 [Lachnospiraceae bacterium]|nr:hypothetical protein [Lachnospiraceae bacterium]
MEMYKSEEVIASITARLHPTDNLVPECTCLIRVTPMHVFVSEDNYDGTYDDHYIIERSWIREIKISNPYKKSNGLDEAPIRRGKGRWARKRGFGWLPGKKDGDPAAKFLEIIFLNQKGEDEHIYFDECTGNPETIIKAVR